MGEGFLGWAFGRNKKTEPPPRPPSNIKQPNVTPEDLPIAAELDDTEDAIYRGELIFATSSNVHEFRYIGATQTLYIRFKSGGIYAYYDFPFSMAMAFYKSDSPGRFVWHHIRDKFRYAKIGEMPAEMYHNVVRTID